MFLHPGSSLFWISNTAIIKKTFNSHNQQRSTETSQLITKTLELAEQKQFFHKNPLKRRILNQQPFNALIRRICYSHAQFMTEPLTKSILSSQENPQPLETFRFNRPTDPFNYKKLFEKLFTTPSIYFSQQEIPISLLDHSCIDYLADITDQTTCSQIISYLWTYDLDKTVKRLEQYVNLFQDTTPKATYTYVVGMLKLIAKRSAQRIITNTWFNSYLNQSDLLDIAKTCAKQLPEKTHEFFIKNLKINNTLAIEELKTVCSQTKIKKTSHQNKSIHEHAELHPDRVAKQFQTFHITDEKTCFEIAKICAKQAPGHVAKYFDAFHITDIDLRTHIAKTCIEHAFQPDFFLTMLYFKKFNIGNELTRINLAKMLATQGYVSHFLHFCQLNIQDQSARTEIARLSIQQNPSGASEIFDQFGIASENDRLQLGNLCMDLDPHALILHFDNFDILNEMERYRFAMIGAEENPNSTYDNRHKFNLSLPHDADLTRLLLVKKPNLFKEKILKSQTDIKPKFQPLSKHILLAVQDSNHPGFDWVLPYLSKISNPRAQEKFSFLFLSGLCLFDSLNFETETFKLCNQMHVIQNIYSLHSPHLYLPLMHDLATFCTSIMPKGVALPDDIPSILLHVLCAQANPSEKPPHQFIEWMHHHKKTWKDHIKLSFLLSTLHKLIQSPQLTPQEKIKVLNQVTDLSHLKHLSCILDLKEVKKLKTNPIQWDLTAHEVLKEKLLISHDQYTSQQLIELFDQTFGKSPDPYAICRYVALIKKTKHPQLMQAVDAFVQSVLNGTFLEKRYCLDPDHRHLAALEHAQPNILAAWKTKAEKIITPNDLVDKIFFKPLEWLKQKLLVDHHLDIHTFHFLENYLQHPEHEETILKQFDASPQDPSISFQKNCLLLAKAHDPEEICSLLQTLATHKYWSCRKSACEFLHDIRTQLHCLQTSIQCKDLQCVDTDDPNLLLLCGDVPGSCQRIDGNIELNKGLLGYLLHGQTRLIAVVDKHGKIHARVIFRLLLNEENKPALFLERFYGPSQFHKVLTTLAKEKASSMNLPLYSIDSCAQESKTLFSLGGPAPYEYSDGGGGIQNNGRFSIQNPHSI